MPVQFVGFTDASDAANPTSGSWTLPSGWVPNDTAVMWWGTNLASKTFTEPPEVTQVYDAADANASSPTGRLFIGYRTLVSGDATFGWSASASSVGGSVAGWGAIVFRDSPPGIVPLEGDSGTPANFASTTTPDPPAAMPLSDGATAVTIYSKVTASVGAATPPSGYTLCGDELVGGGAAYKLGLTRFVSEDPGAWTVDVATAGIVWTGILRPWVTGAQSWSSVQRSGRV